MENKVVLSDKDLTVNPTGLNKVLSFKDSLMIPLNHVSGATVDPGILNESKGFRGLGTGLANYFGGTYTRENEKTFFNVKKGEKPVVIQLHDEKYTRLVLGVADPEALVIKINNAIN